MKTRLIGKTALLSIDVQKGFLHPSWGQRNNPMAEQNIKRLLQIFREKNKTVIHIQHLSRNPLSPLRPHQEGVDFMAGLGPEYSRGEKFFQKSVHSAFIGTNLENFLKSEGIESLVMAGLTSDHCVSTTTRMAANLGFNVIVVADATATFERQHFNKNHRQKISAELIHEVSLSSLKGDFAEIVNTEDFEDGNLLGLKSGQSI